MRKRSALWRWHNLIMSALVAVIVVMTDSTVEARNKTGVLKASDVIGMKVEGTDGKSLGTIKDLVLEPAEGDIQYAVLDFGGFLGIKDKYFVVPWEAITFNANGKKIVLDVSKRDLKKAPGFDKKHWPDFSDQQQEVLIYEFYEIPFARPENQEKK
ncbi:MAG: PRC-barrel domain-containing protein [Nitrospira sp. BO4]|nr:PRC-barrel domain-containing protein [Nitrospira sp. BO4]